MPFEPQSPDRPTPQTSVYERMSNDRLRDNESHNRRLAQLIERLSMEERSLVGFKLQTEKRFGQLWQWQTAAIVLTLVNFALLLFWRR